MLGTRIFLSSTFRDLRDERQAVEEAINRLSMSFVGMEHFGSFPEAPLDRCLRLLKTADLVVLLLGFEPGSRIPGAEQTYTEAEYQAAREGRKPVLAYLKDSSSYSVPKGRALDPPHLIEDLRSSVGVSLFQSPHDLAWKVSADVARELLVSRGIMAAPREDEVVRAVFGKVLQNQESLITILEERARMIVDWLSKRNSHGHLNPYISRFKHLHGKHVQMIRDGEMVKAHETLSAIKNHLDITRDTTLTESEKSLAPDLRYNIVVPPEVESIVRGRYLAGLPGDGVDTPYEALLMYEYMLREEL